MEFKRQICLRNPQPMPQKKVRALTVSEPRLMLFTLPQTRVNYPTTAPSSSSSFDWAEGIIRLLKLRRTQHLI